MVEFLMPIGKRKGATPAQISLAWLLAQGSFIVPILGTRNVEHVKENFGALKVSFTEAELAEIDAAIFSG